jgi:hypothetical protein
MEFNMKICIDYDSCWQTSFLNNDEKKPITKKHIQNKQLNIHASDGYIQKFVATTKARGERPASISNDTVCGVLCRLMGDQRKLYQAKKSDQYYLNEFEDKISWRIVGDKTVNELSYLTNKSDSRCGQSSWLGVLSDDNKWFFSDLSPLLWSILYLSKEELLDFILADDYYKESCADLDFCKPINLLKRIEVLSNSKRPEGSVFKSLEVLMSEKEKIHSKLKIQEEKFKDYIVASKEKPPQTEKQKIAHSKKCSGFETAINALSFDIDSIGDQESLIFNDKKIKKVIDKLELYFLGISYWSNGVIYPMSLYSAALYLQAIRMLKNGFNLDFLLNENREVQIQGFSKRGFNGTRDWLNSMSGGRKKAVGTPCNIEKQSGQLEIIIDVDRDKALEIENLINCAGVSSFYLGKKGLAYVSSIRI